MIKVNEMKFATNLGVLFALKEEHKLKTLQETYQLLEQTDIDLIFEVLCISYNKANKVNMSQDEFAEFLANNNIGFIKMTSFFKDIVEDLMFNGMSPEEVEAQKNALANLMKK